MGFLFLIIIVAIVFIWQFKRLKRGKVTKPKAIGLFAGYSFLPVVLYGVVFFVLAGLEEVLDKAIIGELYARFLLFVLIGGSILVLISTVLFAAIAMVTKPDDNAS
jgi:cytochrome bd-type quinol oxidase subunit 2